jgi:hypothetical protein
MNIQSGIIGTIYWALVKIVDNLPICHVEEEGCPNILVSWTYYSTKKILTKKGEEKKKLILFYKSSSSAKLINYLKPKLQYFMRHNFVSWWQDQQFK